VAFGRWGVGDAAQLIVALTGLLNVVGGLVWLGFTIRRMSRQEREDAAREAAQRQRQEEQP
jgi:uncharacterized membrane protein